MATTAVSFSSFLSGKLVCSKEGVNQARFAHTGGSEKHARPSLREVCGKSTHSLAGNCTYLVDRDTERHGLHGDNELFGIGAQICFVKDDYRGCSAFPSQCEVSFQSCQIEVSTTVQTAYEEGYIHIGGDNLPAPFSALTSSPADTNCLP